MQPAEDQEGKAEVAPVDDGDPIPLERLHAGQRGRQPKPADDGEPHIEDVHGQEIAGVPEEELRAARPAAAAKRRSARRRWAQGPSPRLSVSVSNRGFRHDPPPQTQWFPHCPSRYDLANVPLLKGNGGFQDR